jgi:hypothetical protein
VVNLAPSLAEQDESEREHLLGMSCEDVVEVKASDEARRTSHMPDDNECEVRVHYHAVPPSLLIALETLANQTGRSRSVIEKCLTHHMVALASCLPAMSQCAEQYTDILALNGRYGGLTDIVEQMKVAQFAYQSERAKEGQLRSIRKFMAAFTTSARGLAIGNSQVIAGLLCWSLTTTNDERLLGIVRELKPEVHHFFRYVHERSFDMGAYWQKAQSRLDGSAVAGPADYAPGWDPIGNLWTSLEPKL